MFLGYASGVGKSFRMLDEGRRRKLRGEDVVVAATQPHSPPEVEALLGQLEVIPPLGAGPAIDVPAVIRRHPGVCLIDGLAYRNPRGSPNAERWQDVEELLSHGISVITTINLQYVREKQQQVEKIRGRAVKECVPEAFLRSAGEIEVVDAPASQHLWELREIALLLAAEVVDSQLDAYLELHGIEQTYGTQERILVCITSRSNADLMIRRGRTQADRFHGRLFAVYVEQGNLREADRATLERNLAIAREAKAEIAILHGDDAVAAILRHAAAHGITQIFAGHSQRSGFWERFRSNPVERLILESEGIDVRVFPSRPPPESGSSDAR